MEYKDISVFMFQLTEAYIQFFEKRDGKPRYLTYGDLYTLLDYFRKTPEEDLRECILCRIIPIKLIQNGIGGSRKESDLECIFELFKIMDDWNFKSLPQKDYDAIITTIMLCR